jgi:hypothetical protein
VRASPWCPCRLVRQARGWSGAERSRSNARCRCHRLDRCEPDTGALREGCALLQGLATCGSCGRKLAIFYRAPAKSVPNYYCQGSAELVAGRGSRHMNVGGAAIDAGVAEAFLAALAVAPAALQACLAAARQLEDGHGAALAQHRGRSNKPATTPARPNAAIGSWIRTTGWSPAGWKPSGTTPCSSWPTPRPNSPAGNQPA